MEGEFKPGDHIDTWCDLVQYNRLLSILSARRHCKSEMLHAYMGWRIFNMDYTYFEKWMYFSYSETLAGEHLAEAKERININPFFKMVGIEDLSDAKTILYYRKGTKRFYCKPAGILSSKRGGHPDGIITDDILRDPDNPMDISQILKVNKIFFEQLMSMPKESGLGLINIGTMQDDSDLFHELEKRKQFSCHRFSAEVDSKNKVSLWPEMYPWNRLKEIESDEIGSKAYQKEYLCVPIRRTEGFFDTNEIDDIISTRLKNRKYYEGANLNDFTFGGLDIGKKRHPSHLSIFGRNRKGRYMQILSLWMDGTDYIEQLRVCKEAIKGFGVSKLYYDDTRAEMEGFREKGELAPEMTGLAFTKKLKFQMAVQLEKAVINKKIMLVNDLRQKRQILNVDNDLKSMETPEGHGDSFWSNALAVHAIDAPKPNIRFL